MVNRHVRRIEENNEPVADNEFESLKKERLRLKDELYAMIRVFEPQ